MTPQQAMQQLVPIAGGVIDELKRLGEQNSCIFAGALLTRVLHRRGFAKAYPMTVRAHILNPPLVEWMKSNDFSLKEKEKEWMALGGRGIALGTGREDLVPSNKWFGHMAVIVPNHFEDRHAMLDLTVTQAHKPEWGINLVPMIVRVPDSFIQGQTEFKAGAYGGSMIIYMGFPDDHSYRDSNLWKDQSPYDRIADRVVAGLRNRFPL